MADHALLSASGASKWLNCPPSARLETQFPESTSGYAEEGRLAHAIAELKLRKTFTEPMGPRKFNAALKKLQENTLYQPEMLTHTDAYLDYIQTITLAYQGKPHVAVEQRLDFSHIVPEGFGTGDCIVIGGNDLYVIDFKYGKGVPVEAEGNPQMMLYALGALAAYDLLYDIRTVRMTIVQPRLNDINRAEMSVDELLAWGESIKPVAAQAMAGEGEFKGGDWCRFCRAKNQCRARADQYTALEAFGKAKPPLITNDEVGDILRQAQGLAAWVDDLEEYALAQCLAGELISGFKAVEGRSNRQFADLDMAFGILTAAGVEEALLYERKPLTLAAIEKQLGKKEFADLLADQIIKPPGKPSLVPDTDKREAIANKISAEEAFKEAEQ